ncbi:MAG: hypothetical protein AAGC81_11895 [Pseudomonadota bacterium]
MEWTNGIAAIAAAFSALTALIALVVAVRNERKVEARFAQQIALEQKVAQANIAPDVQVYTFSTVGSVQVELKNCGVGPARISDLSFRRDEQKANSITRLINIPNLTTWVFYWMVTDGKLTLAPGESKVLIHQSTDVIQGQDLDAIGMSAEETLRQIKDQITGVTIEFQVSNIVDEKLPAGSVTISNLP